jgi:hypothetical protein
VDRDRVVGIIERSGNRVPVGARFSTPLQTGAGAHPAFCAMGKAVKRPKRGVNHPLQSRSQVKERVQLYLYFLLWAFLACSRVIFTYFTDGLDLHMGLLFLQRKEFRTYFSVNTSVSVTKLNPLVPFREIIAACKNHTNHINTLCD